MYIHPAQFLPMVIERQRNVVVFRVGHSQNTIYPAEVTGYVAKLTSEQSDDPMSPSLETLYRMELADELAMNEEDDGYGQFEL